MDVRRHRAVYSNDQENVMVIKGKGSVAFPSKRPAGLALRGEVNSNIPIQRDVVCGKLSSSAAENEKKASLNRGNTKSNYSHVQSKVDTGLPAKSIQPSMRPPLRRQESTAAQAVKAHRSNMVLKDIQNVMTNETKEAASAVLNKKEVKKTQKFPVFKETLKISDSKQTTKKQEAKKQSDNIEKLTLTKLNISKDTDQEEPCLPDDIEDIDAADNNNPLLLSTYIKDIYKYLIELEEKYPVEPEHLRNQAVITGKMRATLIDWLVEVQRQFSLLLETFHLTVGIIDRYLQAVPNVQRNRLQLVGVTAMFIASKYEEIYAPDVADFVYVTDNAYTKADVFQCERDIMSKLGFCLARPIPLSFLRRFIKAAHGTSKNHHLAKYFVDLSLLEYSMAHYRPSEMAAAAICLSLYVLSSKKLQEVWTPTLSYYSGYSLKHIEPIMKKIASIVVNVGNIKYKAVYNKYLDTTLAKVSSLPQLKGVAIYKLVNDTTE